jgi:hypothetical protein
MKTNWSETQVKVRYEVERCIKINMQVKNDCFFRTIDIWGKIWSKVGVQVLDSVVGQVWSQVWSQTKEGVK